MAFAVEDPQVQNEHDDYDRCETGPHHDLQVHFNSPFEVGIVSEW
jgi:hypothetical protein